MSMNNLKGEKEKGSLTSSVIWDSPFGARNVHRTGSEGHESKKGDDLTCEESKETI